MNLFAEDEMFAARDVWSAPPGSGALAQINAAIDEAAEPFAANPRSVPPGLPARSDNPWWEERPFCHVQPPPPAEETLLNVLPSSVVAPDDSGRLQVEPDAATLQGWDRSDREAAVHVTSWLNECGAVRPAIERAIKWGVDRFEEVSQDYDARLEAAGFARSAPSVQECDNALRHLHETVEHARDILSDISLW